MGSKQFKKILCTLLCALVLLTGAPGVFGDTAYETETLIDGILSYAVSKDGAVDLQQWVDTALVEGAGTSSEWYIMALCQYNAALDFSAYEEALKKFLQESPTVSAVTKEKYALALLAVGEKNSDLFVNELENAIGSQGLMSWVYGLHLLNNGVSLGSHTVEEAVSALLSAQLEGGGWAIMGSNGDVDVTAMALQALAPYYAQSESVANACETALLFLSEKQLNTGDFSSLGNANSESTAQVLMALCALDIDIYTDSRFIKEGTTVLDGLLRYRLEDGSFCHVCEQDTNNSATVQALCALVSLWRWEENLSPFYQFKEGTLPTLGKLSFSTATPDAALSPAPSASIAQKAVTEAPAEPSYKPWVIGGICLVCGIWCLVLLLKKKKQAKQYLFVLLVGTLLVAITLLTDISSAASYYAPPAPKEDAIGQVTLTIRCDTVAGQAAHIPADGIMLPETTFDIREGDSVYTILTEAAQTYGIQLDNQGSESLVYIAGIGFLYEFDFGQYSGWVYHVNGSTPGVGAGEYILSDGDVIRWLYTCDLGQDVEE